MTFQRRFPSQLGGLLKKKFKTKYILYDITREKKTFNIFTIFF